uniref:GTD-binding domain-containing protein n=1 Tax=Cajanus cajan TaxID=3821 RepID=A0A151S399_CAJCA|nr:hypothetical protein KK1_029078 [Cajanus cajan]
MASGGKETSFAKPKRMKGFIAHLTSAACEWLLIFLLLLDALLSYLLTKFASYCQLQLPCLLCSRLDHILGHEKPELYENLFCSNHKSEISSLVSCHIHGKLADGNKMCDDCLLSVTAKNKRSAKTHRLLVGKLGLVLGGSGSQSPSLSRDLFAGPKGTRQCTCCGKLWKSDQNSPRSIQRKSPGRSVLKPYIPLPCAPRQSRLNHRDSFKKTRDKLSGSEGKTHVSQTSDAGMVSEKNAKDLEKIDAGEKASDETKPVVCDSAPINPIQDNSSNANKSSAATKEREENGFIIEQPTTEEVDKVEEELEQSPLEISSQGYNASSAVPINHVHSPETQAETSSSNEVQVLRKSSSVESGLGSLDESNITEIEGESSVDRLQRQIEYYKKCMDSLQKELEEERNASAVATNEAMSMITRLQEEKAALQMESLQYLRMMEEQAEYDNDELEKVNDLLTDKEKEIQDLEAELEFYRSNMTVDEPMVQNMHKESLDLKGENNAEVSKVGNEAVTGRITFLEFEEEKEYISQCLKNLEEKVHQICVHSPNVRPEKLEVSKSNKQRASNGEGPQLDGHEETCLSPLKNINTLNGNHVNKDGSAALDSDVCSLNVENNHPTSPGLVISTPRREVELELFALENEISDLNDRLEALEFDHDLLEHLTNSLQNGNDGKQFIKDIAHRLQELRKIGIR